MTDRLAVYFDPGVLQHQTGKGFFEAEASPYLPLAEIHPENARRLENMLAILQQGPIAEVVDWYRAAPATREDLQRFHRDDYLDQLASIPRDQSRALSSTTVFGPDSFDIASLAAGQAAAAAEKVYTGEHAIAFALVRPPGHHAQPAMADGYCFFNNIAVAIERLRARGMRRTAVIDWDVHHGNGTQAGYYSDPDVLTISLHMDHGAWGQTHPQTGAVNEAGEGEGLGKNLNIPLPYGAGDQAYLRAFDELAAPLVRQHQPEVLFVAAGQDANQFDPNGRQLLSMDGFYRLGSRARALAEECCGGKLVLVQEGGYAISYAAYCLHATLEGVLCREPGLVDPLAYMQEDTKSLDEFIRRLRRDFEICIAAGDGI